MTPLTPNKQRGEILIKLGDREFVLQPTFGNIEAVESTIGRSFVQISNEFRTDKPSFTMAEVAKIIFIAQQEPKLSYAKIGALLAKHGMMQALKGIAQFMACALMGTEETAQQEEVVPEGTESEGN